MLSFQNPLAFLLLLCVPLLYLFRYLKIFNQLKFFAVLSDWNGKSFEWKSKIQNVLSVFAKVLLVAGYCLVVTAVADPVVSKQEKIYTSLGTDIMFVVDTSPSMAAKDMDGNFRLTAAIDSIKNIVSQNEGSRFGIIVLGSEASVLVPPTNDISYLYGRLAEIKIGMMGNGSAIGDGVGTAVCHLSSSKAPKKCIVLLTDGENNAGEIHPETSSQLAAANEITLHIVGIGSKGTVPIEYTDPNTGKNYSGYLNSNFDATSLIRIAVIGKGQYFEVKSINELNEVLNSVIKQESVTQNYSYRIISELMYKKFLFFAFILLILSFVIKRLLLKEVL